MRQVKNQQQAHAVGADEDWAARASARLSAAGYRRGGARSKLIRLLAAQGCALSAVELQAALEDDGRSVSRASVYRILEELEFAIEEAADGQLAMAACQRQMPDAILLDWNMPVMNGIEFLRALRRMQGGATPVVVFCTTENDLKHIEEAVGAGANEYIMKPFDTDIIQAKFQQVGLL